MSKALFALLALVGLLTSLAVAVGVAVVWLMPAVANGTLNPREQILIDLAGQQPSGATVLSCDGKEENAEVVGGVVKASFGLCEGPTYVILHFKAFDGVCTVPYSDSTLAHRDPWRFRVVGHKCELMNRR